MNHYFNNKVSLGSLKKLARENISIIDFNRIKKQNLPEFKRMDQKCINFINDCYQNHLSKEMILLWDSFYQIKERYIKEWTEYMGIKNADKIMDIIKEIQEVFVKSGSLFLIMNAAFNRDQLSEVVDFDDSKNEFEGALKVIRILDTMYNLNPMESTKNAIKIDENFRLTDIEYDMENIISPSLTLTNSEITIGQLWKIIVDIIIPDSKFVRFFKN